MPTPKVQDIMCSFEATPWLLKPTKCPLKVKFLGVAKQCTLTDPIEYYVTEIAEPLPNTYFYQTTIMVWSIYVVRVNIFFTPQSAGHGADVPPAGISNARTRVHRYGRNSAHSCKCAQSLSKVIWQYSRKGI